MISIRDKLIDDTQNWWKFWSVRLTAIGSALQALLTWWPETGLMVWNTMPDEVKGMLPQSAVMFLPILFFGSAIVARIVKQKNLSAE